MEHRTTSGGETNLSHRAAIEKIREISKHARMCFFGTHATGAALRVRPMSVQSVDDNGELWFLSGRDSDKNESISRDPRVHLMFANPDKYEFLSLEGTAAIHTDRAYREKYWTELAKAWFKGGIDDPNLSVLQVTPSEGYYWDTKSGKTMTLFKILAGALTGKDTDGGVSGKLKP